MKIPKLVSNARYEPASVSMISLPEGERLSSLTDRFGGIDTRPYACSTRENMRSRSAAVFDHGQPLYPSLVTSPSSGLTTTGRGVPVLRGEIIKTKYRYLSAG